MNKEGVHTHAERERQMILKNTERVGQKKQGGWKGKKILQK